MEAIQNHNIVSTDQLHTIVKKSAEKLFNNPKMHNKIPAILVRGGAGVGKSSIIRGVADELSEELGKPIGFRDIRLANMERVDIAGLPSVKNGVTTWNVPDIWPTEKEPFGILLLDEITSAPADVQVAAYSLVLDRKIPNSKYRLPDGWIVVAAGNRAIDHSVARPMSAALANRFSHYEVDANMEDWVVWALRHDINPAVVGYLKYRPANLFRTDKQNLEEGWPSPRSWEKVSNMIELYGDDEELFQKVVYSLIGNGVGVEFMSFYKLNNKFDDVLNMMTNPKAKVVIPTRADEQWALASAVTYLLWNGKNEADEKKRIDGLYRIAKEMSADFVTLMVKGAMAGNSRVKPAEACLKIMKNKNYAEMAKKFRKSSTTSDQI